MKSKNDIRQQIKSLSKSDLEDVSIQSIDTLQKVMAILKETGHDHLLTDLITSDDITVAKSHLEGIRDVTTIISEETWSSLTKNAIDEWEIKSPLVGWIIRGDSAFDAVIKYMQSLEKEIMETTYDSLIRNIMRVAEKRAEENMDGEGAGRALFEQAGIRVWIEVRISNGITRWIIDPEEKGSTIIQRTDGEEIVKIIAKKIVDNFKDKKRRDSE